MPGLFEECENHFGSDDLYDVFNIKKEAKASEVKRAYHKLSLKYHPDRVTDDKKDATEKFQTLGKVYAILSDTERRKIYDETGEVDEENYISQDDCDWKDYWRLLFKQVSVKDIKQFEKKYKGSKEEREDLLSAYNDYEGDMDVMMEHVLCAEIDDEDRFKAIIDEEIKNKNVPKHKAWTRSTTAKKRAERKRKAGEEAAEAQEMAADLGLGEGQGALEAMIKSRQKARQKQNENFFDHLAAKYGGDDADEEDEAPKKAKSKRKTKAK